MCVCVWLGENSFTTTEGVCGNGVLWEQFGDSIRIVTVNGDYHLRSVTV